MRRPPRGGRAGRCVSTSWIPPLLLLLLACGTLPAVRAVAPSAGNTTVTNVTGTGMGNTTATVTPTVPAQCVGAPCGAGQACSAGGGAGSFVCTCVDAPTVNATGMPVADCAAAPPPTEGDDDIPWWYWGAPLIGVCGLALIGAIVFLLKGRKRNGDAASPELTNMYQYTSFDKIDAMPESDFAKWITPISPAKDRRESFVM